MSRRSVKDWRRAVFASKAPEMTGSVKVLCLYLADRMNERDRKVSIPRKQIAADLGCHEQRVAERFKKAVDAEFLVNVLPGFTGRTAVYQGSWPDADCVRVRGTQSDRECTDSPDTVGPPKAVHSRRDAERENAGLCTAPLDATTRADLSASPHGRDDGSNEETNDSPVRSQPTACEWHDDVPCPSDCKYAPTTDADLRRSS